MLTDLLSLVRELGFAKQYQVSTFYTKYLLKVSYKLKLPCIKSMSRLVRVLLVFITSKNGYKEEMQSKWSFHD